MRLLTAALAEETPEELAQKYSIELQSIYAFRHRNKHRIAVTLAEWSDQFSDLWSVKKHARVADLTETETQAPQIGPGDQETAEGLM